MNAELTNLRKDFDSATVRFCTGEFDSNQTAKPYIGYGFVSVLGLLYL